MRPCTITVTNKGRELVSTAFRGVHFVTILAVEIKDDESGEILTTHRARSFDKDQITFKVFYDDAKKLKVVDEELAK